MSKKKLKTAHVLSELTNQSAFFNQETSPRSKEQHNSETELTKKKTGEPTTTPSNHETVVSRYHDAMVETIRKSVKEFGKEAATHRFTSDEKQKIADIVYAYKRLGIRTSENEITRIAINYLIDDYYKNKQNNFLDLVLKALNE